MSILNRLTFVLAVSVATTASFAQDIKGDAKQFTLAELKTLAKYMASQPGDVKTVAQNKFR